jgi:polyisoprenoid-binding protein YceI
MTSSSSLRLVLAAIVIAAFGTTPAAAFSWKLDGAKSQLGFSGTQTGVAFKGRFSRFSAQIDFDPDHPETSHIVVVIDLASAVTGDPQRDGALPGADWFDIAKYPQAKFVSSAVRKTGVNAYTATGTLSLRGITKPVVLPFTLAITGNNAHAKGHLDLVRTLFGVGQGTWSNGQWVGLNVGVDIDVVATR